MFFRVKKSLADDGDELGAVARAVIYSFTNGVEIKKLGTLNPNKNVTNLST